MSGIASVDSARGNKVRPGWKRIWWISGGGRVFVYSHRVFRVFRCNSESATALLPDGERPFCLVVNFQDDAQARSTPRQCVCTCADSRPLRSGALVKNAFCLEHPAARAHGQEHGRVRTYRLQTHKSMPTARARESPIDKAYQLLNLPSLSYISVRRACISLHYCLTRSMMLASLSSRQMHRARTRLAAPRASQQLATSVSSARDIAIILLRFYFHAFELSSSQTQWKPLTVSVRPRQKVMRPSPSTRSNALVYDA